MRKVIYSMMASLDGFMESSNQDLDWVRIDEELHSYVNQRDLENDTYLYGRRIYEVMEAFWPTAEADLSQPDVIHEYARIYQNTTKIVFSRTLEQVGENARLVKGDIATEVARLKAEPGKDMALGGADLAASFFQLGLVDEIDLYLQPVVLGSGKPMFPPLSKLIDLQLVEGPRAFSSGVVHLRYRVAQG